MCLRTVSQFVVSTVTTSVKPERDRLMVKEPADIPSNHPQYVVMFYTIYVNKPHRSIRQQCRETHDGRFILFDGEGSRREVMQMAREAADQAESVNVVWRSNRVFSRSWSGDAVAAVEEGLGLDGYGLRRFAS